MSEHTPKFSKLQQLLLDLGFVETAVPGSHHLFQHHETGAEVVVPSYRANQHVLPRHLMTVRIMLDAKGLMAAEHFDQRIAPNHVKQPATG